VLISAVSAAQFLVVMGNLEVLGFLSRCCIFSASLIEERAIASSDRKRVFVLDRGRAKDYLF